MKPFWASGSLQPLVDEADHDLVGDELARVHVARRPRLPSGVPALPRRAACRRSRSSGRRSASPSTRPACPCRSPGGPRSTSLTPGLRPLSRVGARTGQALVAARDEVRLDLVHGLERDADDDHQARAAELERHVERLRDDARDDADRRDVDRAAEGDAREHAVDVLGGLLARADAGDVRLLLLQVVGDVDRLERDRRVEEAEEDDQRREERVEHPVAAVEDRAEASACPGC